STAPDERVVRRHTVSRRRAVGAQPQHFPQQRLRVLRPVLWITTPSPITHPHVEHPIVRAECELAAFVRVECQLRYAQHYDLTCRIRRLATLRRVETRHHQVTLATRIGH